MKKRKLKQLLAAQEESGTGRVGILLMSRVIGLRRMNEPH